MICVGVVEGGEGRGKVDGGVWWWGTFKLKKMIKINND